ncbi:MAG: cobalamin B12-binding domain-containing protein [Pseudomonadota bacterium]
MCAQESHTGGYGAFNNEPLLNCYEPVEDTGNQIENNRLIAAVVEKQLLPKLALAGRAANRAGEGESHLPDRLKSTEVESFLDLVLTSERGTCIAFVSELHTNGVPLESIYLDLIAPTAQRLEPMWLNDEISFSEISIALARLQSLVSKVARSEAPLPLHVDESRHIVLAKAPMEQHAFGLLMVAEFFRLAGWQVSGGIDLITGPDLKTMLKDTSFSVLGLTAGTRAMALDLKEHIVEARRVSANPKMIVIVGGPAFLNEPDLQKAIGCDCVAADGYEAVEIAEQLVH